MCERRTSDQAEAEVEITSAMLNAGLGVLYEEATSEWEMPMANKSKGYWPKSIRPWSRQPNSLPLLYGFIVFEISADPAGLPECPAAMHNLYAVRDHFAPRGELVQIICGRRKISDCFQAGLRRCEFRNNEPGKVFLILACESDKPCSVD